MSESNEAFLTILSKAMKYQGYLEKESSDFTSRFQKRYFIVESNGQVLSYFKLKEDINRPEKRKGEIPVEKMIKVEELEGLKFNVQAIGRKYTFRAETRALKAEWIEVLETLMSKFQSDEMASGRESRDSGSIKYEKESKQSKTFVDHLFQPLKFVAGTAKEVVTSVKGAVKIIDNALLDNKLRANEEYLKIKRFDQYFSAIDPKLINSRLCMGYLDLDINKQDISDLALVSNFLTDTGIVDEKEKKWFILISAKPIIPDLKDPEDEWLLDDTQIPLSLELETLYYFNTLYDESQAAGKIPLKNLLDISIKETGDSHIHKFVLNLGDKKIGLVTKSYLEQQRWVKALELSMGTCREKAKSRIPNQKNISLIIDIFENQGLEELEDKIREDLEKIRNRTVGDDEVLTESNIDSLLVLQKANSEEYVAVVNACLCQPQIRVDIIKIYSEMVHESIITAIRAYYHRFNHKLENWDLFGMIKFLKKYSDDLSSLGACFLDQRILVAMQILCRVVAKRVIKSNLPMINTVLKQECECKAEVDSSGKLYTMSPNDVFKILNETFNILNKCNVPELASEIIIACDELLEYYQRALLLISKKVSFSTDRLISLCNNTAPYMRLVKEFINNAKIVTKLAEKVDLMIEVGENVKQFIDVGAVAVENLMAGIMKNQEKLFDKPFLELDIAEVNTKVFESIGEACTKIHENFVAKILRQCLERMIMLYTKCFLKTLEGKQFKKEHYEQLVRKLENDREIIFENFSDTFKVTVLNTALSGIDATKYFLVCPSDDLLYAAEQLKDVYGESMKMPYIKLLMDLRQDISSQVKQSFMKDFQTLFEEMNEKLRILKAQADQNNIVDTTIQSKLNLMIEDEESPEIRKQNISVQAKRRAANVVVGKTEIEGHLQLKKTDFLKGMITFLSSDLEWTQMYCTVRNKVFYVYKDKESKNAALKIEIKDMEYIEELKGAELNIQRKNKQVYKFKAKNDSEREVWLNCFKYNQALDESEKEIHIEENIYPNEEDETLEDFEGEVELAFDMSIVLPELFPPPMRRNSSSFLSRKSSVSQPEEEKEVKRRTSISFDEILPERYSPTLPVTAKTPSCWSIFSPKKPQPEIVNDHLLFAKYNPERSPEEL